VVTLKLLPFKQQYSFNRRLGRSQNWCAHSSKEKNHCQTSKSNYHCTDQAIPTTHNNLIKNDNYCNQQEIQLNNANHKSGTKQNHVGWIHMAQNRFQ
jgi:hypothetical protein